MYNILAIYILIRYRPKEVTGDFKEVLTMKNSTLKRLLSFLMAVSMVMSIAVMPAAATEGSEEEPPHTCVFTTETARTEATCGNPGSVTMACSCGETETQEIPATGEHNYENGVCTVCEQNKPCTLALDCDAPQHVEECLSQATCTCVRQCSETMACPVCEGHGECKGGEAAERIAAVQTLIDALPTRYSVEERDTAFAQYQACTDAIAALSETERNELILANYYAAAQPTVIASEVDTLDELKAALSGKAKEINLNADITITGKTDDDILVISGGVTINGNGKTITSSAPRILNVATAEAVSINKLNLVGDPGTSEQRGINVITTACNLSLNSVNISGVSHYAVNVADSAAGNGKISIQDSAITGYSALNISPAGYTTTVTGSALTGMNNFPYHDTNAYAAIVVGDNNTVTVSGGSITASTTKGNIQAIVTATGTGSTIDISSTTTLALDGETAQYVLIGAYGSNNIKIPSADAATLAKQNLTLDNGKVVPILNHEDALHAAVAAGGTVTLEDNITLTKSLVVPAGKTVTLNLNGKTVSLETNSTDIKQLITNNGTLTIQGTGKLTFKHNAGSTAFAANTIVNCGTLTIAGGTIENTTASGICYAVDNNSTSADVSVTVSGGSLVCNTSNYGDGIRQFANGKGNSVSVNGGSVSSIWMQNPSDGDTQNTGNPTASLSISNGTVNAVYVEPSTGFTVSITGGTIAAVSYTDNNDSARVPKGFITGGTFKNGDTVTEVTNYLAPGHTQNTTTGVVSKADVPSTGSAASSTVEANSQVVANTVNDVKDNKAVEKVDTGLDAVYNAENLDAAVQALKNDEANTNADLTGTILRTTVTVTLTGVDTTNGTDAKVTVLTFDVTPQLQAVGENDTVVASTAIPNTALTNKIVTFRLPIPDTYTGKYVSVAHDGNPMGSYMVQKDAETGDFYIEIETSTFSPWTVTFLEEDTQPVATVDKAVFTDIGTAITYLETNGGTMQLLNSTSTDLSVNIPAGKTATVDLNGKIYTYTGTAAAFVNNGTSLAISGGSVAANTGTLAQNTTGALTVTNVTYTSSNTNGYSIEVTGGTATVASGSFSGNAYSVMASGSGAAAINGGTFNKGVAASAAGENTKNITINGGIFNAETNAFNDDVNGENAASGSIYIPGSSTAQFKANPPAAMIQTNYLAVPENGMYKIQKKASVTVNNTEYFYGANENLDTVFAANPGASSFKLSRNEELKNSYTFTAATTTIDFGGKLIYGGGTITADTGKSINLSNIGPNEIDVVLGPGDKAVFGSDGTVTITAAENKNTSGQGVGYGEVLLTAQTTSGSTSSIMYFLGEEATLKVNPNGSLATTGQVITAAPNATKPTYYITQVDDGTNVTSNFVYGSSKTLTFSSNGFFEGFVKVSVDGRELATTAYTAKAGSTIVTLNNSYLKTLTKGQHTLTMYFLDEQTASANFYVVSASKPIWNPQTGDMIMTSVIVMAVAAASLAALLYIGKKKKK